MADGSVKAIEEVEIGDWVWAEDPETGEKGARQVTDLIVGSGEKELVRIVIDGHVITATDGHPFWVESQQAWVDAEDLVVGDIVLTAAGDTLTIDEVDTYSLDVSAVHNLTVADLHTYYVLAGDEAVLVHNVSDCTVKRKISSKKLKYKPKQRGSAPIGADNKPIELHHVDQTLGNASPRVELTRTAHRGKGNFSRRHSNTGQNSSTVNRAESSSQHRRHWEREWDRGRFDDLAEQP